MAFWLLWYISLFDLNEIENRKNILLYIVTSSMVGGLSGLLAFCVTGIHRRLNRIYQKHKKCRITHDYNQCALQPEQNDMRNAKNISLTHHYNQCALDTDGYWCSTKVNSSGQHIGGQGNWGTCSESCPKTTGKSK